MLGDPPSGRPRDGRAWTPHLAWMVMAVGTLRRGKRERARPHGSAPRSRRARGALRRAVSLGPGWLLAVSVVVGLFAMHGLGMHGLHSAEAASPMHSVSSSGAVMSGPDTSTAKVSVAGMTATGHDEAAAVQAETPPADLDAASLGSAIGPSHEPSGAAGLVGICLTLLAFAALCFRRWTRGRPAWTIPRRSFAARVARLSVTARDLSPPLRADLSIWRC